MYPGNFTDSLKHLFMKYYNLSISIDQIFYILFPAKFQDLWISVCTRITLLSSFCMTVVTIYLQKLTVIRCTSRIQRTYNREQFLSIFRKINKYLNFSFPLRISNQLVIDDSSLHFFLIIHNILKI